MEIYINVIRFPFFLLLVQNQLFVLQMCICVRILILYVFSPKWKIRTSIYQYINISNAYLNKLKLKENFEEIENKIHDTCDSFLRALITAFAKIRKFYSDIWKWRLFPRPLFRRRPTGRADRRVGVSRARRETR